MSHIVVVTEQLTEAMVRTASMLRSFETPGTKKPNDRDHFFQAATQFEELVMAILAASSSLSLLSVRPIGARFEYRSDGDLCRKVGCAVSYLREEASEVLKAGGLSQFDTGNVATALTELKALYHLLLVGIKSQARVDMTALADQSPAKLIAAANHLSDGAWRGGQHSEDARAGSEALGG